MPSFFTETGDDGTTGLLGPGRLPKFDLRMETLGALDESSAAIGMARSLASAAELAAILMESQRELYRIMAEVAATPENIERFRSTSEQSVAQVTATTEWLGSQVRVPAEFILPGDTPAGAAFDLARTVVRRAERRATELFARGDLQNGEVLRYLNRLSSLLFAAELFELQHGSQTHPTLAKGSASS
jgi:cob(I)alamin adenosyltransferase